MSDRVLQLRTAKNNASVVSLPDFNDDSIYSIKDDFDQGELNSSLWSTSETNSGTVGFYSLEDEINGWIAGDTGKVDDAAIKLYSAYALWSPARRCSVQFRMEFDTFTSLKFELGFVNPSISLEDNQAVGAVNVKDTPTASDFFGDSAVIVYDTDDDTSCDLFQARNGSVEKVAQRGPSTLANPNTFTFLLSTTETGEARYWINGIHAGTSFIAPVNAPDVVGLRSTQAESVIHPTSNKHIWVMAQNRASNISHRPRLDYIQAWQERKAF